MHGKSAMVWQLRNWESGDPAAQVAQCKMLGLDEVLLKIVDGRGEKWERSTTKRQNYELLPETVAALQEAGINVHGWGWTYGTFVDAEVDKTIELCNRYNMTEYWIDAESHYRIGDKMKAAVRYSRRLRENAPHILLTLCTYRFPKRYQPDFPIDGFTPYMDGWTPQVYFLRDNRIDGGAKQMQVSFDDYMAIRELPYMPVFPTYPHKSSNYTGIWYASGEQLTRAFQHAKDIGCTGFSIWDLPQATQEQLAALRDFVWEVKPEPEPEPPEGDTVQRINAAIADINTQVENIAHNLDVLRGITGEMQNGE